MLVQQIFAIVLLIPAFPILIGLYFLVRSTSRGPFLFTQLRAGKHKKPFKIYKIRTMIENAEELKPKLINLNERTGPLFKIKNDPRYTKIGKFLSHTGLDELPQLINIIKSEMAFVGPRPFPINEAEKIPKQYEKRFNVLPGITSSWVMEESKMNSFENWMRKDCEYVEKKSLVLDFVIVLETIRLIIKSFVHSI